VLHSKHNFSRLYLVVGRSAAAGEHHFLKGRTRWLGQISKSHTCESATFMEPTREKGRSDGRCGLNVSSANRDPGLLARKEL
jgi:hypothetical protein